MTYQPPEVSEMDTFTYTIKHQPDRMYKWNVTVFGPNGKTLTDDNTASRLGAHWKARLIVRAFRKNIRVQRKQVEKTASSEIVGSFHRRRI